LLIDFGFDAIWIEAIRQLSHSDILHRIPLLALLPADVSDSILDSLSLDPERCCLKPIAGFELVQWIARKSSAPVCIFTVQEDCIRESGLHILVADDAEFNREVAVGVLELFGHRCSTVDSGAQAVWAMQQGQYDLVLMDIEMPEMDGLEATRLIRQIPGPSGRTPIIAMTAHVLQGTEDRCRQAGMNACLTKPVQPDELNEALQGFARHPQQADC
jgi:CheY-like chemotaxis protein